LVDEESYRHCAGFLARRLEESSGTRLIVVASAQKGLTDELERLARRITEQPTARALDLLWSTGELRSVALLTLHLENLGVAAVGLNVHETGLRANGPDEEDAILSSLHVELQKALTEHPIVLVPGFFGTLLGGRIVSFGRGGSDLSAVLLAHEFAADRCELIKDVAGYFTADPDSTSDAEHLPWVSYETALEMARTGCELVQPSALEVARDRSLHLVIRGMCDRFPGTVVSAYRHQAQA
jgi:aspartate kinase